MGERPPTTCRPEYTCRPRHSFALRTTQTRPDVTTRGFAKGIVLRSAASRGGCQKSHNRSEEILRATTCNDRYSMESSLLFFSARAMRKRAHDLFISSIYVTRPVRRQPFESYLRYIYLFKRDKCSAMREGSNCRQQRGLGSQIKALRHGLIVSPKKKSQYLQFVGKMRVSTAGVCSLRKVTGERKNVCSHVVLFCMNLRDCIFYLRFIVTRRRRDTADPKRRLAPTVTAESSKDDEEWNTRVCNFVTAHGKRVFPYVPCANCIIPRESTERRELYVDVREEGRGARVCTTMLQYRLHNFPCCTLCLP